MWGEKPCDKWSSPMRLWSKCDGFSKEVVLGSGFQASGVSNHREDLLLSRCVIRSAFYIQRCMFRRPQKMLIHQAPSVSAAGYGMILIDELRWSQKYTSKFERRRQKKWCWPTTWNHFKMEWPDGHSEGTKEFQWVHQSLWIATISRTCGLSFLGRALLISKII